MYYPDRIERYITVRGHNSTWPEKEGAFELLEEPITHEYGQVPVFHLSNNASVGEWGRSELENIIPLQDALNKSLADMLVAMEFVALPQRWVTGFEPEVDERTGEAKVPFKVGPGNIWFANDPQGNTVNFGQFGAADLSHFITVQEGFRMEIARVSGTPLHYFMLTSGNFPSGESMKTAEARFLAKVRDRHLAFGNAWEDAMTFALKIKGYAGVRLSAQWEDPAPKSEMEEAQKLLIHQQLEPLFLEKLGYTEEEIAQIKLDKATAESMALGAFTNGPGSEGKQEPVVALDPVQVRLAAQAGFMTVNEARKSFGLEEMPGGDVPLQVLLEELGMGGGTPSMNGSAP